MLSGHNAASCRTAHGDETTTTTHRNGKKGATVDHIPKIDFDTQRPESEPLDWQTAVDGATHNTAGQIDTPHTLFKRASAA